MKRLILLLVVVFSVSGCYKTVYMNVQGDKKPMKMTLEQLEKRPDFSETNWQHFFVNGWIPNERTMNAAKLCGSAEHILSINTRQTFVQRLIASLTTYYIISIYTPYDGHVVCDNVKKPETSESTKVDSPSSNAKPDEAPPVQ